MTGRTRADSLLRDAVSVLGERLGSVAPSAAIVLGSGLGDLAMQIVRPVRVPFAEVPGFAAAGVHGHAGQVIAGRLEGRQVIALAGRFHIYEGHSAHTAAFPIRLMHALGARTLLVSNAAGGVRRSFRAGDLMLISDHINMMWSNPLLGPVQPGESRFPDMSEPYDRELRRLLRAAALDSGVAVVEGVYLALTGPTYETPAEVGMLEMMGADAVGMSTVPEVIVARALGMRVAGVSCITNVAAGYSGLPLSHDEVLQTTARVTRSFQALVRAFVARLPADDASCD